MMTRRDYIEVSKILKDYQEEIPTDIYLDLVFDFADFFLKDNSNFDSFRFQYACGLDVVPAPKEFRGK